MRKDKGEDEFTVTRYRGKAVCEIQPADVGRQFRDVCVGYPHFYGWGRVSPSDVGKLCLVEEHRHSAMESAEQRDRRKANPDRYRIEWAVPCCPHCGRPKA
jgi:hypothetical protein